MVVTNGTADSMAVEQVADVMTPYLPEWTIGPLIFLTVFLLAVMIGRFLIKPGLRRSVKQSRVDDHLAKPLSRAGMYLFVLLGIAAGLVAGGYKDVFGVLGAMMAAGTFAIGFAMKDTLSSLIAGVSIFFDRPFRIGDWIAWDGHEGIVTDIRVRTTKVETFDNELLTVPNDKITTAVVRNHSARERRRETMTFGIAHDDDVEQAKYQIHGTVNDAEGVLDDPKPTVRIDDITGNAVTLKLQFWVDKPAPSAIADIRDALYYKIKTAFDKNDITIT